MVVEALYFGEGGVARVGSSFVVFCLRDGVFVDVVMAGLFCIGELEDGLFVGVLCTGVSLRVVAGASVLCRLRLRPLKVVEAVPAMGTKPRVTSL